MERLTYKSCMGDYGSAKTFYDEFTEKCALRNALGKYEDLGYTPEELKQIIEKDKLEMACTINLPCNVGDTLYTNLSVSGWYLRDKDKPYSVKVVFIGVNGVDNFFNVEYGEGKMWQFYESDFGKCVFLTKEEAILKLKENKQNG